MKNRHEQLSLDLFDHYKYSDYQAYRARKITPDGLDKQELAIIKKEVPVYRHSVGRNLNGDLYVIVTDEENSTTRVGQRLMFKEVDNGSSVVELKIETTDYVDYLQNKLKTISKKLINELENSKQRRMKNAN